MTRYFLYAVFILLTGCATTNTSINTPIIKEVYITTRINAQQYFTDERKDWIGEFVVFHFHTGYVSREQSGIISDVFNDSEGNIRWGFTPTKPFSLTNALQRSNLILSVASDPYLGWLMANVTKVAIEDSEIKQYITFPRKEHPDWSDEVWNLLKKREIRLGMTTEQVKLSWGQPSDVNRSVGSWGVHEQWIYSSHYLYFENNILSSWQD
jgi:hypothetical protein